MSRTNKDSSKEKERYIEEEYYDEYEDEYYDDYEDEKTVGGAVLKTLIILIFSCIIAIIMWFAADDVLALTKSDNEVTVQITDTDTLDSVAQKLKDVGLINYKSLFKFYGRISHAEEKFSPGTFVLNQQFDYHALVNGLASSSETRKTVTLTFPEGYNVTQIFEMLSENDVCDLESLEKTAAGYEFEYWFLEEIEYGSPERLEGYLFPDTYNFYLEDDPVNVLNRLLNNFNSKFTEEMVEALDQLNAALRQKMEAEGSYSEEEIQAKMMTPYKIITVASLIEKEAGSDDERSKISSVIYNRLTSRVHETLQIDATVEYALGEHKEALDTTDLEVDSPYNTYLYEGLPPGPIANPGLSSIMAAIYPDETTYLFYALNSTGTHSFFETYMEQQDFLNNTNLAGLESDAESEPQAEGTETEPETDGETPPAEEVYETAEEPAAEEAGAG